MQGAAFIWLEKKCHGQEFKKIEHRGYDFTIQILR